jgi:hypothetical protein
LQQRHPLDSLLFALALAVGLTPESVPMIMTVTLGVRLLVGSALQLTLVCVTIATIALNAYRSPPQLSLASAESRGAGES